MACIAGKCKVAPAAPPPPPTRSQVNVILWQHGGSGYDVAEGVAGAWDVLAAHNAAARSRTGANGGGGELGVPFMHVASVASALTGSGCDRAGMARRLSAAGWQMLGGPALVELDGRTGASLLATSELAAIAELRGRPVAPVSGADADDGTGEVDGWWHPEAAGLVSAWFTKEVDGSE
jgi:hypothetical protein